MIIDKPLAGRVEIHAIEVQRPPSSMLSFPVWSHDILINPNGLLDPDYVGIAVGISLISCLGAEIQAIQV